MIKESNYIIPYELSVQISEIYSSWEEMTKEEKLKEIDWCIERCYYNKYNNSETIGDVSFYNSQIKKLRYLKFSLENKGE